MGADHRLLLPAGGDKCVATEPKNRNRKRERVMKREVVKRSHFLKGKQGEIA